MGYVSKVLLPRDQSWLDGVKVETVLVCRYQTNKQTCVLVNQMKSNIFKNEIVYSLKAMIIQRRECGNSGCSTKRREKNDTTDEYSFIKD